MISQLFKHNKKKFVVVALNVKKLNQTTMKRVFFLFSIAIVLLMNACQTSNEPAPLIPLNDFFRNPEKANYQISPDGTYYAYMSPWEDRMNIFVQKIGEDDSLQLTKEKDRDIGGYFWASNERLLYLQDTGGDENFKLYGVDVDGSNFVALTEFEGVRTSIIDQLREVPDEVIVGMNKRNPQVFDPYRLNINSGELTMLAENPGNIVGWLTDHDGRLRVAMAITGGVNQTLLYRDNEDEEFREVITTNFKETLSPQFFTFDNNDIYAVSNLGRDKAAAVVFDLQEGKETEVLYENPDYDVSRIGYSRKDKELTAAYFTSWKMERHFFSEDFRELIQNLDAKLGADQYEVGIYDLTEDENKYIVGTSNDRTRTTYYLYNRENDELTYIHRVAPWLDPEHLAEMKPIEYQSGDGLTIRGYLTLPKGLESKNLPVVIHPHGGPWARDNWGYNSTVQFLANRGYAVLQMNFRGSTGYGREFWEASFQQWGRTMQNDVTDGVNWLIEQGIANEEKIGIFGGSYGGYVVLAGLAFTPELYACGVDYVGVSNMFTFMNTIPPYWEPMRQMMYEMVGDPEEDSLLLAEVSPVLHAENISAPLFIAQGANDPRVNKDESDQMVEALRERGIDVKYMVKDDEGHGFRNEENRMEFYDAMETFLAKYLEGRMEQPVEDQTTLAPE
jgi:dipeptidyl aminopeptidase/acylaminoacyl peptidase